MKTHLGDARLSKRGVLLWHFRVITSLNQCITVSKINGGSGFSFSTYWVVVYNSRWLHLCERKICKDRLECGHELLHKRLIFLAPFRISRVYTWVNTRANTRASFQKKSFLLWSPCLPPHVNPSPRESISFGGRRAYANPAGVAVLPYGFWLVDLVGVPGTEECVGRRRSRNGGHWPFGRFPLCGTPGVATVLFAPEHVHRWGNVFGHFPAYNEACTVRVFFICLQCRFYDGCFVDRLITDRTFSFDSWSVFLIAWRACQSNTAMHTYLNFSWIHVFYKSY